MKNTTGRLMRFRRNQQATKGSPASSHTAAAHNDAAGAANTVATHGRFRWHNGSGRMWLILLVCLIGSTAASFVLFKYVAPMVLAPSIPPELVGTWQVMDGPMQGATLEFSWHGSATAVLYKEGKKQTTNSSAELKGKVLFLTTRDAATGKDELLTQTILQMTQDELVFRDEDHQLYRMKRVRG